jgi:hypothetical protein
MVAVAREMESHHRHLHDISVKLKGGKADDEMAFLPRLG